MKNDTAPHHAAIRCPASRASSRRNPLSFQWCRFRNFRLRSCGRKQTMVRNLCDL